MEGSVAEGDGEEAGFVGARHGHLPVEHDDVVHQDLGEEELGDQEGGGEDEAYEDVAGAPLRRLAVVPEVEGGGEDGLLEDEVHPVYLGKGAYPGGKED